jgi:hypothetical protein
MHYLADGPFTPSSRRVSAETVNIITSSGPTHSSHRSPTELTPMGAYILSNLFRPAKCYNWPMRRSSGIIGIIGNLAFTALVIVGGYVAIQNHNQILDWWYLRSYTPPARIVQLADRAGMTDEARRIFYRAQPQIETDRAALVRDCHIKDDETIELGCYLSSDKIYLLDIQQPELADEMVVTAAHETLHAAYDRLSRKEQRQIDAELSAVAGGIKDADLKKRMADYGQLEPGEEVNELHSILGSEYSNLSPALERYYTRYFANRGEIIALSNDFNTKVEQYNRYSSSLLGREQVESAQ